MLYIVEDNGTMKYYGPFHSASAAESWLADLSDDIPPHDVEVKQLEQPEEGNE